MDFAYRLIIYIVMANVAFMMFSLARKGWRVYLGYLGQLGAFLGLMAWMVAQDVSGPSALGIALVGLFGLVILPVLLQKQMEKLIAEQRFDEIEPIARWKAYLAWSDLNRHMVEIARAVQGAQESALAAENGLKTILGRGEPFDGMTRLFLAMVHFHAREFHHLIDDLVVPEKSLEAYSFEELLYIVRGYLETGRYQEAIAAQSALEKMGGQRESDEQYGNVLVNRMLFFAFFGWIEDFERLVKSESPAVKSLPPVLIQFWSGVASFHAGAFEVGRQRMESALHDAQEQLPDMWTAWMENRIRGLLAGQEAFAAQTLPRLRELQTERRTDVLALMAATDQEAGPPVLETIATNQMTALIVIAFLLFGWFGNVEDLLDLLYLGANSGFLVKKGEWFRLCSSLFLHIGWIHLLMNLFALRFFGPPLETVTGWQFFWGVYFFSGMSGALASAYLQNGISAGASGAVLGLLSATIVLEWSGDRDMRKVAPQGNLATMIFILAINILVGLVEKGVDNHAHLGGLLGGAVAGALIRLVSLSPGLKAVAKVATVMGVSILLFASSFSYAAQWRACPYPFADVFVVPAPEALPLHFGLPLGWELEKEEAKSQVFSRILTGPIGERLSLTWGEFDESVETFLTEYHKERTRSIAEAKGLELKSVQDPKEMVYPNGMFYLMQWRFAGGTRPFVERDYLGILGKHFVLVQGLFPTAQIEKYEPLLKNLLTSMTVGGAEAPVPPVLPGIPGR